MKKIYLVLTVCAALVLASCTSYKNVPILIDSEYYSSTESTGTLYDARIMPKDLLTITVNTTDPKASAPYNLTAQVAETAALQSRATTQASLMPYLVSNEGTIDFPVLGTLRVVGMTKNECETMIREKLSPYIKGEIPVVTVRMPNFKISVIGEVNRPGQFTISNEKVNILEALALAGDMTIYGVRDNVRIIRENAQGKRVYYKLNLNDPSVIDSPYYQLQQNDIVVVSPNKTKAKNSGIGSETSLWFSATSILVSLASLLFNILK